MPSFHKWPRSNKKSGSLLPSVMNWLELMVRQNWVMVGWLFNSFSFAQAFKSGMTKPDSRGRFPGHWPRRVFKKATRFGVPCSSKQSSNLCRNKDVVCKDCVLSTTCQIFKKRPRQSSYVIPLNLSHLAELFIKRRSQPQPPFLHVHACHRLTNDARATRNMDNCCLWLHRYWNICSDRIRSWYALKRGK